MLNFASKTLISAIFLILIFVLCVQFRTFANKITRFEIIPLKMKKSNILPPFLNTAICAVLVIVAVLGCTEPEPTPGPTNPDDKDTKAPTITLVTSAVGVYGGKTVAVADGKLSIGETEVAIWTDDKSEVSKCKADLAFTAFAATKSETISSGATLDKTGILNLTVTDEAGNSAYKDITITDQIVFGIESLAGLDLQIDKEVNLISGLSFYEGWSLAKVEIEKDGVRTEVTEPEHYISSIAGDIVIIITLTDGSKTAEFKSGILTVKPLAYTSVLPQAATIFPDFNTANVQAYKRWGIYELAALAKSMQVRNGIKIIIFRDGKYIPHSQIHKWIGPDDDHGEEVYRNVNEGTGDSDNIWAADEGWVEIESDIINLGLSEEPIIITSSHEIVGANNAQDLVENQDYCSLKRLGHSDYMLVFDAAGNVNNYINYKVNEEVTNIASYYHGKYRQTSAADPENNNIIPVTYGRFKDKAKFGVYQDIEHGAGSACAYISIDNRISPYGCVEFADPLGKNRNEEWSEGFTSTATPALAAMAKNAYDILHKWGILNNMTELKWMLLKYSTKIPATRQDIAADGTIIEDVDNGFVLVPDMLRLINEEIYPAIIGKASKTTDGTTLLHKDDGLNIAYSGAGTEYQAADGSWKSTDGVAITEFFGKPQRFNPALLAKYGISGDAAPVVIHLTDKSGLEIVSSEVALP